MLLQLIQYAYIPCAYGVLLDRHIYETLPIMTEKTKRNYSTPVGTFEAQLGRRLKELRLERTALSQEKFAYSIDMDRTYYASLERGLHTLSVTKLKSIAGGLGLSMSEVLQGL